MTEKPQEKDNWDKAKIVADILKIVAILGVGLAINTSLKSRELDLKYTQLAVGILQTEPNESVSGLRAWAVEIIDSISGTPLTEKAKNELLNNQLPARWDDNAKWDDSKPFGGVVHK